MSVITTEAIGSLRADIRRVETTLGARLDMRLGATELLLREEIQREIRQLHEEIARLREEIRRHLLQPQAGVRHQMDGFPSHSPSMADDVSDQSATIAAGAESR